MNFLPIIPIDSYNRDASAIAIFGGGGKTSLLHQIGHECSMKFEKVLLTSIVKAGPSNSFPIQFAKPSGSILPLLLNNNPLYLMKEKIREDKFIGFSSNELESWIAQTNICIFEADGARGLPLKSHNHHDPNIPHFTTHTIIVVGADAVDTKLSDGKIHRPDLFQSLWSINKDTRIDAPFISKVVTSERGYLSKIPDSISKSFFINKADAFPTRAKLLAEKIATQNIGKVFYGSIKNKWWENLNG